jgi:hypothetical protein
VIEKKKKNPYHATPNYERNRGWTVRRSVIKSQILNHDKLIFQL